ncbi:MAG: hypothetical protein M1839_008548 [Geoglossum umbratile]|nr:MAG: hypothetical protein M1839_008548 [Geoglossum umbratile]
MATPDNVLFSKPDGEVIRHYLCQTGDDLTETTFDGVDLNPPLDVGSARVKTPGTYLLGENNARSIYCLTPTDTLQDFTYDPAAWEWDQGGLAGLQISTSSNAKIAALSSPSTKSIAVFFHGQSGEIQSASTSSGEWQLVGGIPTTKPAQGGGLCAIETHDGVTRVFYTHEDSTIHQLAREGDQWTDLPLAITTPASSSSPPSPSSLAALPTSNKNYLLQFHLGSSVYLYNSEDGTTELVGTVGEDGVVKDKGDYESSRGGPKRIR